MSQYEILFAVFAFVLGSSIGSFLNVCIYRMPIGLSVNEPKRSFCPNCKYQIPWWNNLPLISWLKLGGKCANCGQKIAFRYFGVELLTGLLFLAVWLHVWPHHWVLALPFWVMTGLFVVATFIDFEHFIIPHEITWGGAAAGVVCGLAIPTLHGVTTPWEGAMWAIIGGVFGYVLVMGVVEGGKLVFGKKAYAQRQPVSFTWIRRPAKPEPGVEITPDESDADLVVGDIAWKSAPKPSLGESISRQIRRLLALLRLRAYDEPDRGESWVWSETFGRESDLLTMKCLNASIDGEELGPCTLLFTYDKVKVGDREWNLEKVDKISGTVTAMIIPREAMGYGDVNFMACIGAFLGWKGVLFTLAAASMVGAFVGVSTILIGKREWSAKIPFGPYLSLGALIWTFGGPQLVAWYLAQIQPY